MEKEKITDLLTEITDNKLSPNEFFTLFLCIQGKPIPETINELAYKKSLILKNWLDINENPTEKCIKNSLFANLEINNIFRKQVEEYRLMWPSIILPNGKNARASLRELEIRFNWFFNTFQYDWNNVFKATEEYIKYYQERRYSFMRTSAYFIYKEMTPKLRTSDLAEWCENVLNKNESQGYDINV